MLVSVGANKSSNDKIRNIIRIRDNVGNGNMFWIGNITKKEILPETKILSESENLTETRSSNPKQEARAKGRVHRGPWTRQAHALAARPGLCASHKLTTRISNAQVVHEQRKIQRARARTHVAHNVPHGTWASLGRQAYLRRPKETWPPGWVG